MSSPQTHQIDIGSLTWFYRETIPKSEVAGSPVILLHGLVSQSYSWRHTLTALAEQGFRGIAPDWIGFGSSAKPDVQDFAYTPDAYIAALAELVQTLEIERFSLVIQGFLGSMGLQYALRYRDQVDRIVILNAPILKRVQLPWAIRLFGFPLVGEMLTQDPLLVDRTLEGGAVYQVSDQDLDVYRRPFLRSSEAGRSLLAVVRNLKLSQAMQEIEAGLPNWSWPTLLAWGMQDPWIPFETVEPFSTQARKRIEVIKLDQAGHYPQQDWQEKVSQIVIPFLRKWVV